MRWVPWMLLISSLAAGCDDPEGIDYVSQERLNKGLVLILPGVEGEGPLSHSIREGLANAGIPHALKIYNWGQPIPLAGPLLNQVNVWGNRAQGQQLAQLITDYQDSHPGRPVHVLGHSGGGGIAVFAAESLPQGRRADGLVLLSASISANYDLTKAMAHVKKGILNFHSTNDVATLMVVTTVVGNVNGVHGASAGALGFDNPVKGLFEMPWTQEMGEVTGNNGGHYDSADSAFITTYIAPWVKATQWPASNLAVSKR